MIYFILRSTFISLLIPFLNIYKQDSILICLVGSLFSFIFFHLYLYFLKQNNHKNIIVYLSKKLPIPINFIVNIVIVLSIIFFGATIFYKLLHFISSEYLKQTSIFFITICFILFICYLSKKSFSTLSKACFIFLSFSLILYLIKVFGLIGEIKIENIMPLYKINMSTLFIESLKYAFIVTLPLFLLLQVSKENIEVNKNLIKKTKIIFVLTCLLLFINLFLIISVMGPNLMSVYSYPDFHLLSNIKLLGFISKIESLLSLQWIIDMVICITLCLLYVKTYLKYYLPFLFPHSCDIESSYKCNKSY